MIVGVGIDVCAVERVSRLLARWGERFTARILTPRERALLGQRTAFAPALAARYAAKEAFAKATAGGHGVRWHHVEVLGGRGRPPEVAVHGPAQALLARLGATRVHLSLSHDAGVAVAVMILEAPDAAGHDPRNTRT